MLDGGASGIAHMGTQNCNGYLEAPRGREDYVDPPDSVRRPMKSIGWSVRWRRGRSGSARWPRSRSCLRRSCFSFAHRVRRCVRRGHMPAAGRFTPEPRQERRCESVTARPQVPHRDLREPVCRNMKKPQANQCTGADMRLPAPAGRPITCCRSKHGNRVQVLVAQRFAPLEVCSFPNPFPTENEQSHAGSERLTPDLDR